MYSTLHLYHTDDDVGNDGNKLKLQRAASSRIIVFSVDASIKLRPGTSIQEPSMSYPFFEPEVILTCGAGYFPPSSDVNVRNGDKLKVDHWDSSLRLRDAALSIATQVRRSIRSGNLCIEVEKKEEPDEIPVETTSTTSGGGLLGKMKKLKELRGILKKAELDTGDSEPEHKESEEARKIKKLRELRASRNKAAEVALVETGVGSEASSSGEVVSVIPDEDETNDLRTISNPISENDDLNNKLEKEDGDTEQKTKVASMTKALEEVMNRTKAISIRRGYGIESKAEFTKEEIDGIVKKSSDEDTMIYDTVTESIDEILSVIAEVDEEDEDDTVNAEDKNAKYVKEKETRREQLPGKEELMNQASDKNETENAGQASNQEDVGTKRIVSISESLDEILDGGNPPTGVDAEESVHPYEKVNKSIHEDNSEAESKLSGSAYTDTDDSIGDVIYVDQCPYNQAHGLYPCEVVRRPEFIETKLGAKGGVSKVSRRQEGTR